MPKKSSEGHHLPGMIIGDQVAILKAGDTYISLRMPTKPVTVAIPAGYLGITDIVKGVVTSVSVVPEDSKLAHRAKKHHPI